MSEDLQPILNSKFPGKTTPVNSSKLLQWGIFLQVLPLAGLFVAAKATIHRRSDCLQSHFYLVILPAITDL
jgi:hypothetical protein